LLLPLPAINSELAAAINLPEQADAAPLFIGRCEQVSCLQGKVSTDPPFRYDCVGEERYGRQHHNRSDTEPGFLSSRTTSHL
jgi:hypothetical protein